MSIRVTARACHITNNRYIRVGSVFPFTRSVSHFVHTLGERSVAALVSRTGPWTFQRLRILGVRLSDRAPFEFEWPSTSPRVALTSAVPVFELRFESESPVALVSVAPAIEIAHASDALALLSDAIGELRLPASSPALALPSAAPFAWMTLSGDVVVVGSVAPFEARWPVASGALAIGSLPTLTLRLDAASGAVAFESTSWVRLPYVSPAVVVRSEAPLRPRLPVAGVTALTDEALMRLPYESGAVDVASSHWIWWRFGGIGGSNLLADNPVPLASAAVWRLPYVSPALVVGSDAVLRPRLPVADVVALVSPQAPFRLPDDSPALSLVSAAPLQPRLPASSPVVAVTDDALLRLPDESPAVAVASEAPLQPRLESASPRVPLSSAAAAELELEEDDVLALPSLSTLQLLDDGAVAFASDADLEDQRESGVALVDAAQPMLTGAVDAPVPALSLPRMTVQTRAGHLVGRMQVGAGL